MGDWIFYYGQCLMDVLANPNDILFAAASRVATATPGILNWIVDKNSVFEDAEEDCIHCAVEMKNFNFIRWAKSNILPNFWHDRRKICK